MTRRAFLLLAAGLTAAGAGALAVARLVGRRNLGEDLPRLVWFGFAPAARLRYHYAWLAVDPAAFDSYLTDYQRNFGRLGRFSIPGPDFYTHFLLSTNFFASAAGRSTNQELVHYTIFYEPSASLCYNPLAQPPPSDAELARLG